MSNMEFYADGVLKELKRLNSNFEKLTEVLLEKFERTNKVHLTKAEEEALLEALCEPQEREDDEREIQATDSGNVWGESSQHDDKDQDVRKADHLSK